MFALCANNEQPHSHLRCQKVDDCVCVWVVLYMHTKRTYTHMCANSLIARYTRIHTRTRWCYAHKREYLHNTQHNTQSQHCCSDSTKCEHTRSPVIFYTICVHSMHQTHYYYTQHVLYECAKNSREHHRILYMHIIVYIWYACSLHVCVCVRPTHMNIHICMHTYAHTSLAGECEWGTRTNTDTDSTARTQANKTVRIVHVGCGWVGRTSDYRNRTLFELLKWNNLPQWKCFYPSDVCSK